ncbi:unnamed protein product [Closterium sp. NIES-53]
MLCAAVTAAVAAQMAGSAAGLASGGGGGGGGVAEVIDAADRFGRTPLMYACEAGAQICTNFLVRRGATITRTDEDDNGVFQLALLAAQLPVCINLLDHAGVDIHLPATNYRKFPSKLLKRVARVEWRERRMAAGVGGAGEGGDGWSDVEEEEVDGQEEEGKAGGVRMAAEVWEEGGSGDGQESKDGGEGAGRAGEEDATMADAKREGEAEEVKKTGAGSEQQQLEAARVQIARGKDAYKTSTFRVVLDQGWNGLAYLMLDRGVDLLTATHDCLASGHFSLLLTLLRRAPPAALQALQPVSGRTVFHQLARKHHRSSFCQNWLLTILQVIEATLSGPGVTGPAGENPIRALLNTRDVLGQTPLHLACAGAITPLVQWLLPRGDPALVNACDAVGSVPLHRVLGCAVLHKGGGNSGGGGGDVLLPDVYRLLCVGADPDVGRQAKLHLDLSALATDSGADVDIAGSGGGGVVQQTVRAALRAEVLQEAQALRKVCTLPAIMTAVRRKDHRLVELLLRFGANPNQWDATGATALTHAVRSNDPRMITVLMGGKWTPPVLSREEEAANAALSKMTVPPGMEIRHVGMDLNQAPAPLARSAYHAAVATFGPLEPSYENTHLLKLLHRLVLHRGEGAADDARPVAFRWETRDSAGHTVLYDAGAQSSGVMLDAIKELMKGGDAAGDASGAPQGAPGAVTMTDGAVLPGIFETEIAAGREDVQKRLEAAEKWLTEGSARVREGRVVDVATDARVMRAEWDAKMEAAAQAGGAEVDEHAGDLRATCVVLREEQRTAADDGSGGGGSSGGGGGGGDYSVLMTRTDVEYGRYGFHNFYKMQVLHSTAQDLYILFNRWGRVGDEGEHQQTPMGSREEAVKEFEKIFKAKSGNDWQNRGEFQPKVGKYTPVRARPKSKKKAGKGDGKGEGEGEGERRKIPKGHVDEEVELVLPLTQLIDMHGGLRRKGGGGEGVQGEGVAAAAAAAPALVSLPAADTAVPGSTAPAAAAAAAATGDNSTHSAGATPAPAAITTLAEASAVAGPSRLPKAIQSFIRVICDVSALRAQARRLGAVDTYLAFGDVTDEALERGREVLEKMSALVPKYEAVGKKIDGLVAEQQRLMFEEHEEDGEEGGEGGKGEEEHGAVEDGVEEGSEAGSLDGAGKKRAKRRRVEEGEDGQGQGVGGEKEGGDVQMEVGGEGGDGEGGGGEGGGNETTLVAVVNTEGGEGGRGSSSSRKVTRERIAEEIKAAQAEQRGISEQLVQRSNEFYQLVPSSQHTRSRIQSITSRQDLLSLQALLSSLGELQLALKMLIGTRRQLAEAAAGRRAAVHPLDYCYLGLGTDMRRLDPQSQLWRVLARYVYRSASARREEIEVYDVFAVRRAGERERFDALLEPFRAHRQLLFHGSSVANFCGLLSGGLRVAPPEADVTGYAFGKGIYFADQFIKSLGYCDTAAQHHHGHHAHWRSSHHSEDEEGEEEEDGEEDGEGVGRGQAMKQTRCLLLCEVALGQSQAVSEATYMEEALPGSHSTFAIGRTTPDLSQCLWTPDGCCIPTGPIITHRELQASKAARPEEYARVCRFITAPEKGGGPCVERNEYVVYREAQVQMRYLLCVGPPRMKRGGKGK